MYLCPTFGPQGNALQLDRPASEDSGDDEDEDAPAAAAAPGGDGGLHGGLYGELRGLQRRWGDLVARLVTDGPLSASDAQAVVRQSAAEVRGMLLEPEAQACLVQHQTFVVTYDTLAALDDRLADGGGAGVAGAWAGLVRDGCAPPQHVLDAMATAGALRALAPPALPASLRHVWGTQQTDSTAQRLYLWARFVRFATLSATALRRASPALPHATLLGLFRRVVPEAFRAVAVQGYMVTPVPAAELLALLRQWVALAVPGADADVVRALADLVCESAAAADVSTSGLLATASLLQFVMWHLPLCDALSAYLRITRQLLQDAPTSHVHSRILAAGAAAVQARLSEATPVPPGTGTALAPPPSSSLISPGYSSMPKVPCCCTTL